MTETLPRITIPEMGEVHSVVRHVEMWGHGGDMRAISGGGPMPPRSPLERSALAFDVVSSAESGGRPDASARNGLVDLLSNGLRMVVTRERDGGDPDLSDVDRARAVMVSMAMVLVARDQADGLEPAPLGNPVLERMRLRSGIEASAFDRGDVGALAVGMVDLVSHPEAVRQIADALSGVVRPVAEWDAVDDGLAMADATWPRVEPSAPSPAVSAAKGGPEGSAAPAFAAMAAGASRER